jgi:hypothetical protein
MIEILWTTALSTKQELSCLVFIECMDRPVAHVLPPGGQPTLTPMTPLALALVLTAAVCHATWNLVAKRAGGGGHFVLMGALLVAVPPLSHVAPAFG